MKEIKRIYSINATGRERLALMTYLPRKVIEKIVKKEKEEIAKDYGAKFFKTDNSEFDLGIKFVKKEGEK